jgi:hypothetical protein
MKKQISNDTTEVGIIRMAELIGCEEKPDKGFYTVEQWAHKLGLKYRTVGSRLRELVQNKKVIEKTFRIKRGDGIRPTAHFKEA